MVGSRSGAIMNIEPAIAWYWKHHVQFKEQLLSGPDTGVAELIVETVEALAPIFKKKYPWLNANGMVDDAVTALRAMISPIPPNQAGD